MNLIREDYLKLIRPYYDVDLIKLVSKPEHRGFFIAQGQSAFIVKYGLV